MRKIAGTYRNQPCNFFGRGGVLLLFIVFSTVVAAAVAQTSSQLDDQKPKCPVNQRNDKETCSALLSRTTEECDCYIFCNGRVVSCSAYGEELVPFECVGSTVAGCSKDMLLPPTEEDGENTNNNPPTSTSTTNNVGFNTNSDVSATKPGTDYEHLAHVEDGLNDEKEEDDEEQCAVTVNAIDSVCADYMTGEQSVSRSSSSGSGRCDCYNFCNGKLIDCLEFGERRTFTCSGELVAGCLETQRSIGTDSSASSFVNLKKPGVGTTTTFFLGVFLSLVQAMELSEL